MNNHLGLYSEIDSNQNELKLICGAIYTFRRGGKKLVGMYKSNNHAFWMNGNYLSDVGFCDDVEEFNNA